MVCCAFAVADQSSPWRPIRPLTRIGVGGESELRHALRAHRTRRNCALLIHNACWSAQSGWSFAGWLWSNDRDLWMTPTTG